MNPHKTSNPANASIYSKWYVRAILTVIVIAAIAVAIFLYHAGKKEAVSIMKKQVDSTLLEAKP